MKKCPKCNEEKLLLEFSNNKNNADRLCRVCKKCQAEYDNKHYLKNTGKHKTRRKLNQQNIAQWLKEYKQKLSCIKCGDKRYYLIDFHHKNPNEKEFNISDLKKRSISAMLNEIEKCVPLCSNCHREFHHLEKNDNIDLNKYLGVAELERH